MPRRVAAAAKPTRSPITPAAQRHHRRATLDAEAPGARRPAARAKRQLLVASPGGSTTSGGWRCQPAPAPPPAGADARCAARFSSVTTMVRRNGTSGASSSSARSSRPAPDGDRVAPLAQATGGARSVAGHQHACAAGSTIAMIRVDHDSRAARPACRRCSRPRRRSGSARSIRPASMSRGSPWLEQRSGAAFAQRCGRAACRDRPAARPRRRAPSPARASPASMNAPPPSASTMGALVQQARHHPSLQLAEARLAVERENVGDAQPGRGHDLLVGVGEAERQGRAPAVARSRSCRHPSVRPARRCARDARAGPAARIVAWCSRRRWSGTSGSTLNQRQRHRYKAARLERGNRQLAPGPTAAGGAHARGRDSRRIMPWAACSWSYWSLSCSSPSAAAVFLATWDIPAPTKQVETVVPDERLPR